MKINKSIFKAYDIRGVYPLELNEATTLEVGKALFKHFGKKAKIVVGRDGRLSSPSLYKAVLEAFSVKRSAVRKKNKSPNANRYTLGAIPVGMITTPMLYFLVNKLKADGGVMVTASHNPKEYNGLKVVGKGGKMISGKKILEMLHI